jgi:hypothetical protein
MTLQSDALRRGLVVLAAAFIAVAASWVVVAVAQSLKRSDVTWPRVLWVIVSAEIVLGVYKWGVGQWSRYTPPPESQLAGTAVEESIPPR